MKKILELLEPEFKDRKDTWVVTGVAGFIGSHLAEILLSLGQNVRGIDNFATGKQSNINFLSKIKTSGSFTFLESDINDFDIIKGLFVGAQHVLHQAALGSVPRSIEHPELTHEANVNGFLKVFDAAREAKIKRLVYASSSSVYGDSEELPKVEERIGRVLSPYAASKLCNEVYSDSYTSAYDIEAVGLRYFNVFGPRQDPNGPYAAVIPKWLQELKDGKVGTIYGDGETSRDFCFVHNVVLANIRSAIVLDLPTKHTVFNVACGEQTSLKSLYRLINEEFNLLSPSVPLSEPMFENFRKGDIRHSHANISKITKCLNYKPLLFISEGIGVTVKHFMDFRNDK